VFVQARSRFAVFAYVAALLAVAGDRKSCWQLGEQAGHATPQRMQALLAEYAWDWRVVLERLQRFIMAHLADREAILGPGTGHAGVISVRGTGMTRELIISVLALAWQLRGIMPPPPPHRYWEISR
jgi:hypothetical protein